MIDLAIIKTTVELFEKLLDLLKWRSQQRAKAFDEIVKPLFAKLERITEEYLGVISYARGELRKVPRRNLDEIRDEIVTKRTNLILARNGILGSASAMIKKPDLNFQPGATQPKTVNEGLEELAYSVLALFEAAGEAIEGEENDIEGTPLSSLTWQMRRSKARIDAGESDCDREYAFLVENADRYLAQIAERWTNVGRAGESLKLLMKA